jgi:replicative superfamily II helicase
VYKFPVELNNRKLLISPYNTEKEKDLLIMSSFEIYNIDEVLRILGIKKKIIRTLSENEKKVLLYKFREISVGDEINIKFKCTECKSPNESVISCGDLIIKSNESKCKYLIKQLDEEVSDENIHEFLDISKEEIDNLDLDEYEDLIETIKSSQTKYNFIKKCACMKCKKENNFYIGDIKYIIESLSEDTLYSIYRTYNDMCMFGNYNKRDIDSLYPFERTILIGLINKTKEDMK